MAVVLASDLKTPESFGSAPGGDELTRRWALIEKGYGPTVGGPEGLSELSLAQKWQIICLHDAQQHARAAAEAAAEDGEGGYGFGGMLSDDDDLSRYVHSPTRWLDRLRDIQAGQFSLALAADLKLQLRAASGRWLREFYELGGLRCLVERLADLASREERKDHELLLQSELLKCLKAAANHKQGIDALTEDAMLVPALALNLSSEDVYVATQVLELLAVIMVDGRNGHRAILDAMDYFKLVRGERARFACLVQVLWDDAPDLSFKRDVLLFLNTVVNSSLEVEERIETRSDMLYAGLLDAFEKLKNEVAYAPTSSSSAKSIKKKMGSGEQKDGASEDGPSSEEEDYDSSDDGDDLMSDERYEVEMQMQLFETVMHSDHGDALYSLSPGPGMGSAASATEVSLADPSSLFGALRASAMEFDCGPLFLSTLQHLLLIPSYDPLGKQMWQHVEAGVHATVVPTQEQPFVLTLDNQRNMLGWKERLETLSLEAAEAAGSAANLSVKVQRLEASLKQDKSKRAVLRQTFKAKMAAATRESDILKGALRAANVPIPDLTPLPSTEEDEKKKGAGEGEAEEDEVDDEEVSAAEMVLLLRQEVAHLKKELEVANAKVANAAAAQSGAVVDEEEEEEEEEEVIALKDDPKFAKYFKMLAMHLPKPAVEMKMRAEGVDPSLLDQDPNSPSPNQPPSKKKKKKGASTTSDSEDSSSSKKDADSSSASSSSEPPMKVKDDPKFAKYFKMLAMHLPKIAVEAKMKAEGVDPSILDLDPESVSPNSNSSASGTAAAAADAAPPVAVKDDPRFLKYFKMLSMHLPRIAVENKMKAEGVDPAILDLNPDKPVPASLDGPANAKGPQSSSQAPEVLLKDDPKFAKYFKMLRMHLPKEAVAAKMKAEGADASVLDLDPNQPTVSRGPVKRTGGGFALPPPPPKYPKKLSEAPPVPMRALFWQRIAPDELDGTVWEKLTDSHVPLDESEIITIFSKDKPQAEEDANAAKQKALDDVEKLTKGKNKAQSLLDPKVLQNVGIALAKFRLPIRDIKAAVLAMDESVLSLEMAKSLANQKPTPEDKSTLGDFEGDVTTLGKVEQFFLEVMKVPRYDTRLDALVFKLQFNNEHQNLEKTLKTVKQAINEVLSSQKLRRILEVVLKVGNFMNGGTSRGGLYGYRLDALFKLATIKSVDQKRNLMNYLADWCFKHDPPLLLLADELPTCASGDAGRQSLAAFTTALKGCQNKVKLVGLDLEAAQEARKKELPLAHEDRFIEAMASFHEDALQRTAALETEHVSVSKAFQKLLEAFGEDPAATGVGEFFGDLVGSFLSLFATAHAQNEKRRHLEAKARAKAEAAAKRSAAREARAQQRAEADAEAERVLAATGGVATVRRAGGGRGSGGQQQQQGASANGPGSRRGSLPTTSKSAGGRGNGGSGSGGSAKLADNIFTRMRNMQQQGNDATAAPPPVPADRGEACRVKPPNPKAGGAQSAPQRGGVVNAQQQKKKTVTASAAQNNQLEATMARLGTAQPRRAAAAGAGALDTENSGLRSSLRGNQPPPPRSSDRNV